MSSFGDHQMGGDDIDGFIDPGDSNIDDYYDDNDAFTVDKMHLNITTSYQPKFGGKEAFREVWQSW